MLFRDQLRGSLFRCPKGRPLAYWIFKGESRDTPGVATGATYDVDAIGGNRDNRQKLKRFSGLSGDSIVMFSASGITLAGMQSQECDVMLIQYHKKKKEQKMTS